MESQPGGGVQADLSDCDRVQLRRHGHRVPRRGRPTDRRLQVVVGLPVPAAAVQRRPTQDHPAGVDVLQQGRRNASGQNTALIIRVPKTKLGFLYDVIQDEVSFGHSNSWVKKCSRSDYFYRLIYFSKMTENLPIMVKK